MLATVALRLERTPGIFKALGVVILSTYFLVSIEIVLFSPKFALKASLCIVHFMGLGLSSLSRWIYAAKCYFKWLYTPYC